MFWIIGAIIFVVIWILLIKHGARLSAANTYAIYHAEASAALERGQSIRESIEAGLEQVRKHDFFKSLTDSDVYQLSLLFCTLDDIKYMGMVLVEARKTNNLNLLTDERTRLNIVMKFTNAASHHNQ